MVELSELKVFLDAAIEAARSAGQVIRSDLDRTKHVDQKANAVDLVTETDKKCEKMIIEMLKEKFPSHKIIGEETTAAEGNCELTSSPTWIIDPVDGTTNFVHRFPFVAVLIGLAIDKEMQVGVVYNAPLDLMYTAIKGQGAYLNGDKRLAVSGCTDIRQALLATEIGANRESAHLDIVRNNYFAIASLPCHSIRSLGSAGLNMCMVASGEADGYWEFGIHVWDIAAPSLILTEAGGVVRDTAGGSLDLMARKILCAATPELVNQMAEKIQQIEMPRD